MSTVHPHSFAVAVATAGAVEAHLRCLMHERDARLRSRYRDRVLGGSDDRALVTSSGRVIATEPAGLDAGGAPRRCRAYGGEFTLPVGRARVRGAAGSRRGVPRPPARARAGGPLRRRGPAAPARRRAPARRSSTAARCRSAAGRPRSSRCCACGPGGLTTEQLGAEVYGDDASNSTRPRRGLAAAQAARAGDRDGPLPPRRPRRVRPRARAHAARARGGPGGGRALRRAAAAALRRARASSASATRSRAGSATR